MKRSWKTSVIALVCIVIALITHLLFSRSSPSQPPSLSVQRVWSSYPGRSGGMVLLSLTNGSDDAVFFQPGFHPGQDHFIWLGIERKQGEAWLLEHDPNWRINDAVINAGINRWPAGKARDFRLPIPADGETRRIVIRWRPAPRQLSPILARMQRAWRRIVPPKDPNFTELRTQEFIIKPSPLDPLSGFDFAAARKRIRAGEHDPGKASETDDDYQPGRTLKTNKPLGQYGVGY